MKKKTFLKMKLGNCDNVGQRIDNFLLSKLKGIPRSMIYRLLRKGEVRVNKKRVKPKYKVVINDEIYIPPLHINAFSKSMMMDYKKIAMLSNIILYEDDYILVLNKPSGTAVHGGSGLNFGIIEGLRMLRPKTDFFELVHRLDFDTSGALLIAKKRSALRMLHKQLRDKEIQKNYLALVSGCWESQIKVIQAPLVKNRWYQKHSKRIVYVGQEGKSSETRFKVEERYKFSTLMYCRPITGRTHQIRVHAQYAGHPIAFDNRYGDKDFDKKLISTGLSRLFLHTSSLKFIHPNTNKLIRIEAPMDKQLQQCINCLRKTKYEPGSK